MDCYEIATNMVSRSSNTICMKLSVKFLIYKSVKQYSGIESSLNIVNWT